MPRDPRTSNRRLLRLVVFAVSGWVLLALARLMGKTPEPAGRAAVRPRRRLVTPFVTAVLFFAGASLTAVAGDRAAGVLQPDAEEEAALVVAEGEEAQQATEEEPAPAEGAPAEEEAADPAALSLGAAAQLSPGESPAEPAPGPELEEPEAAPAPAEPQPEPAPAAAEAPEAEVRPATAALSDAAAVAAPLVEESSAPVLAVARARPPGKGHDHKDHDAPLDAEASTPGTAATVWLHRVLPDPTPPSRRLAPGFARALVRASKKEKVHWSLVLGALRAEREGPEEGRMFAASGASLNQMAAGLAAVGGRKRDKAWTAVLSLQGDTTLADRAVVLADYYRAVGLKALVRGLRSQEEKLAERVLADKRITIYGGGRADIAEGRVDVRVVATIAFLAESFGQVTVSCLISGHGLYSRPGVISRHIYGAAVDVAALDNQIVSPFTQHPGGLVEQAVRKTLLLPAELRPQQVISLLGLGGPSFPLANHDDHIHIGF